MSVRARQADSRSRGEYPLRAPLTACSHVLADSRVRGGRERDFRSYSIAAASTSDRVVATSVARLKAAVVSRCNQNAMTEVDAWNRFSRVPAPWLRTVALQTALLTQPSTSTREHSVNDAIDERLFKHIILLSGSGGIHTGSRIQADTPWSAA